MIRVQEEDNLLSPREGIINIRLLEIYNYETESKVKKMRCKLDPIEDLAQMSSTNEHKSHKPSTSSDAICRTRRVTVNKPSRFIRKFGDKRLPRRLEDMQDPERCMKNKLKSMKLRSHRQRKKEI